MVVVRLDTNLQASFIDHIAHLTSKDYAAIPQDLVKLGFITAGKEKLVEEAGVVTALTSVYSQLAGGGGVRKINVAAVVDELTGLTNTYGNLFQIPAYFAYIARAFGVLEGIGLSYDPNYAIVGECLPYISQRLLADRSEETGKALGNFIFGAERDSVDRVIDAGRFEMLIKGYGRYVASSSDGIAAEKKALSLVERADQTTSIILDLLLTDASQPTPLQEILIDELAKVLSAGARSVFSEVKRRSGILPNGRSVIGTLLDPLNLLPISQLFDKDAYDERVLEATQRLLTSLNGSSALEAVLDGLTPAQVRDLARVVGGKLISRRVEILALVRRLSLTVIQQNQPRLERANIPLRLPNAITRPLRSSVNTVSDHWDRSKLHGVVHSSMKVAPLDAVLSLASSMDTIIRADLQSRLNSVSSESLIDGFVPRAAPVLDALRESINRVSTQRTFTQFELSIFEKPPHYSYLTSSKPNIPQTTPAQHDSPGGDSTSASLSERCEKFADSLIQLIREENNQMTELQMNAIRKSAKVLDALKLSEPRAMPLRLLPGKRKYSDQAIGAANDLISAVATAPQFEILLRGLSSRQFAVLTSAVIAKLEDAKSTLTLSPTRAGAMMRQELNRLRKSSNSTKSENTDSVKAVPIKISDDASITPSRSSREAVAKATYNADIFVDRLRDAEMISAPSLSGEERLEREQRALEAHEATERLKETMRAEAAELESRVILSDGNPSTFEEDGNIVEVIRDFLDSNLPEIAYEEKAAVDRVDSEPPTLEMAAASIALEHVPLESRDSAADGAGINNAERSHALVDEAHEEAEAGNILEEFHEPNLLTASYVESAAVEGAGSGAPIALESGTASGGGSAVSTDQLESKVIESRDLNAVDSAAESEKRSCGHDNDSAEEAIKALDALNHDYPKDGGPMRSVEDVTSSDSDDEKKRAYAEYVANFYAQQVRRNGVESKGEASYSDHSPIEGSGDAQHEESFGSKEVNDRSVERQLLLERSIGEALRRRRRVKVPHTVSEKAEEFVDVVIEVLVHDGPDPSPQHAALVDELANIISAGARSTFSMLSKRVGALPNGRSVFETIIDPLNLFSDAIEADDSDQEILKSTQRLFSIFGYDLLLDEELDQLDSSELRELASVVGQKLLSRSPEIVALCSNTASAAIRQSQQRLNRLQPIPHHANKNSSVPAR